MALSIINPNFENLRQQLIAILATKDSWKDILTSGVGETSLEFSSALGVLLMSAIEAAAQEANPDTAQLEESLLAYTRGQGVRVPRKVPARMSVPLRRTDIEAALVIRPFTKFSFPGGTLYNASEITFGDGSAQPSTGSYVYLSEGTANTEYFTGNGRDFQAIIPSKPAFQIADQDVQVKVNSVTLGRVTRGLWNYRDERVWQDFTTKTGNLQVQFGSTAPSLLTSMSGTTISTGTLFGEVPASDSTIEITYATTQGANGNNSRVDASKVTCQDTYEAALSSLYIDTTVLGSQFAVLSGGSDQLPGFYFRDAGPRTYAEDEKAVTRQDYNNLISRYPGVMDGQVLGQRDLNPADNRYMNFMRLCVLTAREPALFAGPTYPSVEGTTGTYLTYASGCPVYYDESLPYKIVPEGVSGNSWSYTQLQTCIDEHLEPKSMYGIRYGVLDNYFSGSTISSPYDAGYKILEPRLAHFRIRASVYCFNTAELNLVKSKIIAALKEYLRYDSVNPKRKHIYRDIYRSDLHDVIKAADKSVDSVVIHYPTMDVLTNPASFDLTAVPDYHGGTLPIGQYAFAVTAVYDSIPGASPDFAVAETKPLKYQVVNLESPGSVRLTWRELYGATFYRIYLQTPTQGLLVTLPAGTTAYDYIATSATGPLPPVQNTAGTIAPFVFLDLEDLFNGPDLHLTMAYTNR